jgi:hypothetical protein
MPRRRPHYGRVALNSFQATLPSKELKIFLPPREYFFGYPLLPEKAGLSCRNSKKKEMPFLPRIKGFEVLKPKRRLPGVRRSRDAFFR